TAKAVRPAPFFNSLLGLDLARSGLINFKFKDIRERKHQDFLGLCCVFLAPLQISFGPSSHFIAQKVRQRP
ncbi:hypothetical protein, partial [Sinorhizobium sp. Sb3]|uniref:hypothetical protein n=1 Tax=Sinorhizobium sp. Sb3 TaxID=1358417 RepID=UPI001AEC8A3E